MGPILIKVRLVRKVRLTIINILSTKGGFIFLKRGHPVMQVRYVRKVRFIFIPNSYFPEKRTHNHAFNICLLQNRIVRG